ncbi:MAG: flavodoxin domain-containing protein [Xanthomonadales bacterium]|nr:flavodoxin domain-containing protein [Xanthomonadales bacterium]
MPHRRLYRLWWVALLALAATPLLWARWPLAPSESPRSSARALAPDALIERWRAGVAAAAADVAPAASAPAIRNDAGIGDAAAPPMDARVSMAAGLATDSDGPRASARLIAVRAGDAARPASLEFVQDGRHLLQPVDAISGAALAAPEPAPRRQALSREAAAIASGLAWLLLALPWLRSRIRFRRGIEGQQASQRDPTWWVVHASQTGQAQQWAEQTVARLRLLGARAQLCAIAQLDADGLRAARRLLLVVSTTGEGDAPDTAAAFVRRLMPQTLALSHLQFAVLALGDRSYRDYCAFGRALDAWLQGCAARPLFERIEVDDGDPQALDAWLRAVEAAAQRAQWGDAEEPWPTPVPLADSADAGSGQRGASAAASAVTVGAASRLAPRADGGHDRAWQRWRLQSRTRLNPRSAAPALCDIELLPVSGAPLSWQPGDVAVLQTQNSAARVQRWMAARGLDGAASIVVDGRERPLSDVLRERALDALPLLRSRNAGETHNTQALAVETVEPIALDAIARLPRLPSREYSIASTAASGRLRLIVRRQNHADGRPGLGSATLLDSDIGAELNLKLRSNPGFRAPPPALPLVLIGAGSGLAGLLGLLDARIEQGARDNWLLFGERDPQRDCVLAAELQAHVDARYLLQLDRCFSRDPVAPAYIQDALRAQALRLRDWLDRGAHLRVCGSRRGMGEGVHACLIELLGEDSVDALLAAGRYRREVF